MTLIDERQDFIDVGLLEEASLLLDRAQWELELLVGRVSRAGFFYTKQETEVLFQNMDFAFGISASRLKRTVAFLTQEGLPFMDQVDDFYDASLALQKTLCLFLDELAEVQ